MEIKKKTLSKLTSEWNGMERNGLIHNPFLFLERV